MGSEFKIREVVILLVILLIAYFIYKKWSGAEHMDAGTTMSGDICADAFRVNEELRVSVVGKGQFQRWYLTNDGIINIQQGTVLPGGTQFRVDKVMSRKFTNDELAPLRKLYRSKPVLDIYSGVYRPDITHLDTTLCNPKDKGWMWTYRTEKRCISVECRGRKIAMDSIQDEILRLSASIPGFQAIKS